MSLMKKLQRQKKHIVREGEKPAAKRVEEPKEIRHWETWKAAGAELFEFEGEYCITRETHHPLDTPHGLYTFNEAQKTIEQWSSFSGHHPLSAKGFHPSDLYFFDIETTGLSGSGSVIFLLGTARIHNHQVTVKQFFLPSPGNETALYAKFLQETDYTTLVTYNGKSFDWPQVKSRHTFVRERVPALPAFGHFDLYHASRRLFKHTMDSVKLVNVEKKHLGLERVNDVPGHLAPIIYFDFIDRGDPEGVLQVMKHNERDILSLITLYTHISRLVLDEEGGSDDQTTLEVGKWFEASGNRAAAKESFQNAAKSRRDDVALDAAFRLAMQLKKEHSSEEAVQLFTRVRQAGADRSIEAAIELAKLYEHKRKNIPLALRETKWALQQKQENPAVEAALLHRLCRLEKKLSK
ncbi:ribonuclease H-like domain-containing protein [Domibacillus sp. PGB-M46]|uniref:ribonuclease H-like domain-containing protein n=1 Tax=Domibacillus sp. PGB-M46 TaxID=2910255 RepID=UPI001F5875B9|nr:ribonuclease H-like domain-containing protein [Domibacillus sp. PGB-M46]MCI2254720.1 ribonuclease H-like domain-containing protein [Domibacillus sp. PGB-M46]